MAVDVGDDVGDAGDVGDEPEAATQSSGSQASSMGSVHMTAALSQDLPCLVVVIVMHSIDHRGFTHTAIMSLCVTIFTMLIRMLIGAGIITNEQVQSVQERAVGTVVGAENVPPFLSSAAKGAKADAEAAKANVPQVEGAVE